MNYVVYVQKYIKYIIICTIKNLFDVSPKLPTLILTNFKENKKFLGRRFELYIRALFVLSVLPLPFIHALKGAFSSPYVGLGRNAIFTPKEKNDCIEQNIHESKGNTFYHR